MATIEVTGLTKRFGAVTAVDDLSFTVPPGRVTAFLGPNGRPPPPANCCPCGGGLLLAAYGVAFALVGSRFVVRRDIT